MVNNEIMEVRTNNEIIEGSERTRMAKRDKRGNKKGQGMFRVQCTITRKGFVRLQNILLTP